MYKRQKENNRDLGKASEKQMGGAETSESERETESENEMNGQESA